MSGGGNQPPPDVDQLKLREVTSDFAEEASEGGSDTSCVQKLAVFERNCSNAERRWPRKGGDPSSGRVSSQEVQQYMKTHIVVRSLRQRKGEERSPQVRRRKKRTNGSSTPRT